MDSIFKTMKMVHTAQSLAQLTGKWTGYFFADVAVVRLVTLGCNQKRRKILLMYLPRSCASSRTCEVVAIVEWYMCECTWLTQTFLSVVTA